jgi:CO dehydrogenase maturation factor
MKIAVTGKGGVGKTVVAGVLANFFVEKGFKVLAIDADPSPNLAITLGIPLNQANKIVPISENTQLIEQKTSTGIGGMYRLTFRVDDIVEKFSVKSPYGVNLLVMGTIKLADSGCMCPANAVLRELLRHLLVERDEVVVMDMEAGVEHMGRGTAKHVDTMLIVTEPSLKSMETARKLHGLARDIGVQKIFIVGNKVANSDEAEQIKQFATYNKFLLLGLIPYDERILKADMRGETLLEAVKDSSGVATIRKIGEELLAHKR